MARLAPPPKIQMNFPPAPGDVPKNVTDDLAGDYQASRQSAMNLPRKEGYDVSKFKKALGLLGGYGANLAAASPLWYARAGAPQLAKLSKDVTEKPYADAMQRWNEEQAIAGGLSNASSGMAKTTDTLANNKVTRDMHRASTELTKQKPAMASRQEVMPPEMAEKEFGISPEEYQQRVAAGDPPMADRSHVNTWQKSSTSERVATARNENWSKVKLAVEQSKSETAQLHEATKVYTAELSATEAAARQTAKDLAAMDRVKERGKITASQQAQRNANVNKLLQYGVAAETNKVKALESADKVYNTRMKAAREYLGKDPLGNVQTPEQLAASGDPTAAQRLNAYHREVAEAERQKKEAADTATKSYSAIKEMTSGKAVSGSTGGGTTPAGPAKVDDFGQPIK